jgi:hypothetical protein
MHLTWWLMTEKKCKVATGRQISNPTVRGFFWYNTAGTQLWLLMVDHRAGMNVEWQKSMSTFHTRLQLLSSPSSYSSDLAIQSAKITTCTAIRNKLWPSCCGTDEHAAFLPYALTPTVVKKIQYTLMQGNKFSNWPDKHFFCTLQCTDQHSITAATFTFQDKIILLPCWGLG